MKKYRWMTIGFALASLLVFVVYAFAEQPVEVSIFNERYVLLKANTFTAANVEAAMKADSAMIHAKQGVLVEIADETPARAELQAMLGLFTHDTLAGDSMMIAPIGSWQYGKPVVFMVSANWSVNPLVKMFLMKRSYAELETSGIFERAKNRTRELVFKQQRDDRDKMDRMFQQK